MGGGLAVDTARKTDLGPLSFRDETLSRIQFVLTETNLYELCRGRVVLDDTHDVEIVLEDVGFDRILNTVQAAIRDQRAVAG